MRLPNFLIVGAPKCGTTALFHYLSEHPNVFLPEVKEPHFFADDLRASNYIQSRPAYEALFLKAGEDHRAVGEASVCYLYSSVAAARIRDSIPNVKIITMFRDPVDMFVSLHNQTLASLFDDERDPEAAWALQGPRKRGEQVPEFCEEPRFLYYGDFCQLGAQLRRWLDLFPKEQIHGIVFDDLKRDPRAVYRGVLEFLELPDDGRADFPRVNEAYQARWRWFQKLHTRLDMKVRLSPKLRERRWLFDRLRPFSRALRSRNVKKVQKPHLRPEFRAELDEFFAPDTELLASLLGRQLPWAKTLQIRRDNHPGVR